MLPNTGVTTKDGKEARAHGSFRKGNQYIQAQRPPPPPTRRVTICTWAVCFSPGSPGSNGERRGGWDTQTQADGTGLNERRNWDPQQALELRQGHDSGKAGWDQTGAHSRLFWRFCPASSSTSTLSLIISSNPMCSTLEKNQRPNTHSQWPPKVNLHCPYVRKGSDHPIEGWPSSIAVLPTEQGRKCRLSQEPPNLLKMSLLRPSNWESWNTYWSSSAAQTRKHAVNQFVLPESLLCARPWKQ